MKRVFWSLVIATAAYGALAESAVTARTSGQGADAKDWIQLFNGKDLDGWVPKIKGYDLGDNFGDTFRVANGVLQASYDKYTRFDEKFGHLFYQQQKFSHYLLP